MKINNPNNLNCFKKKKVSISNNSRKTPKSKSKSKAKSKQKKFNPLQYLNALIQLTETNSCTTRKRKPSVKRDLSSALTLATPALQKTISTSKVRSKSSYSQYRKKTISGLKQVLDIKLDNAVTQEDNIQFTQITELPSIVNLSQSIEIHINSNSIKQKRLPAVDHDYYARKIQRAWKNYQTFNVVNKYYEYFRKIAKKQKKQKKFMNQQKLQRQNVSDMLIQDQQSQKNVHRIIVSNSQNRRSEHILQEVSFLNEQRSKQLQKTLKIKKQPQQSILSEHIAQQELNSTAKKVQIIRCISQGSSDSKSRSIKLDKFQLNDNQNILRQRNYLIHQSQNKDQHLKDSQAQEQVLYLKQKQTQKLNQALRIIKKNKKTSQELLEQLIQKFQKNKRALQLQTEQRLSPIVLMDAQQFKRENLSVQEGSSFQNSQQQFEQNQNNSQKFLSFNSNQAISSQLTSPYPSKQEENSQCDLSNQFMGNQTSQYQNNQFSTKLLSAERPQPLEDKVQKPYRLDKSGGSFQKYEGLDEIDLLQQMSNSSKSDIYNSVFDPICNTDKLFDSRLNILNKRSQKLIQSVQRLALDKKISEQKASQKKQQIQGRYQRQKRKIQKSKIKYYTALKQVKKQAIHFQKDVIKFNQAQQFKLPIRKCFSAQSIILKCIINQPHVLNFDIQDFQDQAIEEKLLQSPQNSKIIINGCQSQASYFDKDFQHIQKCSQQIQKIIQKQLVNQIIEQIYTNQGLYKYFKPFVQQTFQFTKITDSTIIKFIKNIPNYIQDKKILSKRMNQKINPSSLQILKLIRDYDFQIEEYELILPQQSFKGMRKNIQQDYGKEIKQRCKCVQIPIQLENIDVIDKVLMKQNQKRTKNEKYLNFERDLKIMYMKSVFNCMNQFLIQQKSMQTFMNNRSSIGPGELTLSIKEFNNNCDQKKIKQIFVNSQSRVQKVLINKCMMPSFKNYQQIQLFQSQMANMLRLQLDQTQFKWVNFMDQVLQIWNDIALEIVQNLFQEASYDLSKFQQFV